MTTVWEWQLSLSFSLGLSLSCFVSNLNTCAYRVRNAAGGGIANAHGLGC